jgi:hypothetical protein
MDDQQEIEATIHTESKWLSVDSGRKMTDLIIAEKLFILTIDDERGEMPASVKAVLRFGLAGALLAELTLANKFQLNEDRLLLIDPIVTHNGLFDEIMGMVALEQKPRKLIYWVEVIGRKQTVREVAERLASRNVISIEKERYPWISPSIAYPQVDGSAKYWVKQRLREIILAKEQPEAADIILFSLLRACQLLRLVFTSDERRSASKKVEALAKGDVFGKCVAKLLEKR